MKKLLALVLALVMTLSLCVTSNAAYTDAADVDYKEAVDVMTAIGVFNGDENGKFNPAGTLTREQGAKILTYMLLGKTAADALIAPKAPFSDVAADRWSAGSIAYCVSEGIIAGVGNGKFDPTGELTGYAFAKMCLVALGYRADMEGLTGADWSLNTATMIRKLDLANGIDAFVGSKVLNRETAAQITLNTIQKDEVYYDTTSSVNSNGITTVGTNTRAQSKGTTLRADVFPKLAKTPNTTDDLGHPATKWSLNNVAIGTYASEVSFTYTKNLNNTAGKKTVKEDLGNYSAASGLAAGYKNGSDVDTDAIAGDTGNGTIVEVFVKDNQVTKVVVTTPILATVAKVESKKVTLTGTGLTVTTIEDGDDVWSVVSGLKKNDEVIVIENTDQTEIVKAYEPTEVTGKLDKFANEGNASKAAYTLGGTVYNLSTVTNTDDNHIDLATDLTTTRTILLDEYGYIVKATTVASKEDYAFVLNSQENMTKGEYNWTAQLLFTDGTKQWVDVSKVGSKAVEDASANALNSLKMGSTAGFVTYKVDADGKYELTAAATEDGNTGAITKGSTSKILTTGTHTGGFTASNATIFLVKKDSTYTVYTGIKNIPTMNVSTAYVQYTGDVAGIVVVYAQSAVKQDQVFIYDATAKGAVRDGNNVIYTYSAIVDGEDTTIDVLRSTNAGTSNNANTDLAVGLWAENSYDADGWIADLDAATGGTGDPIDANDTNNASGIDYYYAKYTDDDDNPFVDVTMKDGVVSIIGTNDDNTANEVKATYVAGDVFHAWMIDLGEKAADEITLDETGTRAEMTVGSPAATWTLEDGVDYVTYVLDKDGYITDLYLVNVN